MAVGLLGERIVFARESIPALCCMLAMYIAMHLDRWK
jgi:hypothetical protein